jgi:S1-C subfamily serine protease
MHSVADLAAQLEQIGVGNKATLTVERNGATRKAKVDVIDISER